MLSDEQIDLISTAIAKGNPQMQELKDDLLDHFCCLIEAQMQQGSSFEQAYQDACKAICPNGVDEIYKETFFLLHYKYLMTMKTIKYAIGLLASISISVGWLFKILHWPGADNLFNYGFLGFVLVFLPLLAMDQYKGVFQRSTSEKWKVMLGFGSGILLGLAVLFKMLHLQGADLLILIGVVTFSFGFLPFLFYSLYRNSMQLTKSD